MWHWIFISPGIDCSCQTREWGDWPLCRNNWLVMYWSLYHNLLVLYCSAEMFKEQLKKPQNTTCTRNIFIGVGIFLHKLTRNCAVFKVLQKPAVCLLTNLKILLCIFLKLTDLTFCVVGVVWYFYAWQIDLWAFGMWGWERAYADHMNSLCSKKYTQ